MTKQTDQNDLARAAQEELGALRLAPFDYDTEGNRVLTVGDARAPHPARFWIAPDRRTWWGDLPGRRMGRTAVDLTDAVLGIIDELVDWFSWAPFSRMVQLLATADPTALAALFAVNPATVERWLESLDEMVPIHRTTMMALVGMRQELGEEDEWEWVIWPHRRVRGDILVNVPCLLGHKQLHVSKLQRIARSTAAGPQAPQGGEGIDSQA